MLYEVITIIYTPGNHDEFLREITVANALGECVDEHDGCGRFEIIALAVRKIKYLIPETRRFILDFHQRGGCLIENSDQPGSLCSYNFV